MHCIDHRAPRLHQLQEMISCIINSPQYYKWKIISHTDKHTQKTVPSHSVTGHVPTPVFLVSGGCILFSLSPCFISWTDGTQVAYTTPYPTSLKRTIRHALTYCKHIHTASPLPKLCNTILPAPRTWVWKSWSIFINPQPTHCCCHTEKVVYL